MGIVIGLVAVVQATGKPDAPAASSNVGAVPVHTPSTQAPSRAPAVQQLVQVPNLAGWSLNEVEGTASAEGWTLSVKRKWSDLPEGSVIGQSPAPGTELPAGGTLVITLAIPQPAPEPVEPEPAEPEPAPAAPSCHPSYEGACLDPNASDYDCAGGSGDGPYYTGPVRVVGPDEYGLDSDGDGYGCEG